MLGGQAPQSRNLVVCVVIDAGLRVTAQVIGEKVQQFSNCPALGLAIVGSGMTEGLSPACRNQTP
jgi:hypothetical protein